MSVEPLPADNEPEEDAPELASITQLEFFRDIGPARAYVNLPGFGKIPSPVKDGKPVPLRRGDVLTLEATVLVTGGTIDNKGRKIKGLPKYVRTKRDEFVYLTQPVEAEIIRQHRPEEG